MAVDFEMLKMPVSQSRCLEILAEMGVVYERKSIIETARARIGQSIYKRGALPNQWPEKLDCSALTKWSYGELGIWMPRHSIDQREFGVRGNDIVEVKAGDLVFTTGYRNYYWEDVQDGVGHVGIASSSNSIIHAANSKIGIVETYLDKFTTPDKFRGTTRIVSDLDKLVTLTLPESLFLETSTAVRWRILQNLK